MAGRLDQHRSVGSSLCEPSDRIAPDHDNAGGQAWFPVRNYRKDYAPERWGNYSLCCACLHRWDIGRVFVPGIRVHGVCKDVREFRAAERRCGDSIVRLVFAGTFISRAAWNYNYVCSRTYLCTDSDMDRERGSRCLCPYWYRFGRWDLRIQTSPEGVKQCQPLHPLRLAIGKFTRH